MENIVSVISTVGFPIGMCLIVCYYVYLKDKSHKEEIDKLSDAVNAQTQNIQKLIDKIDCLISKEDNDGTER